MDLDETVDADEARTLIGKGEARSIDLRSQEERENGHPPGSVAVGDRDPKEAADDVLRGEDLALLVFCADGERSEQVASELRDQDVEAAAVEGGWEGWLSAGEPTLPRPDSEYEGPDLPTPGS